jgi:hypothetical protein
MTLKKNTSPKWILSILLLVIVSVSFAWAYNLRNADPQLSSSRIHKAEEIDPQAKKILMDMSNYLKSQKEFSFQSQGYFEVIDSVTGNKEKMNNSGELFVKRPNKIKVQRTGEKSDVELYCDGKQVTLYGKKLNYYASAPAASNLDETFDNISENLNIQLPGMDLLYSNVYKGLIQDVTSGKHMGKTEVGKVKCDHLSFIGKEVDWQIWIEEGEKKLPRKYVITSKMVEGKPEASIEITEWKTNIKLEDKLFTFTPPKTAKKIDFLQPKSDTQSKNK